MGDGTGFGEALGLELGLGLGLGLKLGLGGWGLGSAATVPPPPEGGSQRDLRKLLLAGLWRSVEVPPAMAEYFISQREKEGERNYRNLGFFFIGKFMGNRKKNVILSGFGLGYIWLLNFTTFQFGT